MAKKKERSERRDELMQQRSMFETLEDRQVRIARRNIRREKRKEVREVVKNETEYERFQRMREEKKYSKQVSIFMA